jgi:glycerol-3-phosphate dehydrogenase
LLKSIFRYLTTTGVVISTLGLTIYDMLAGKLSLENLNIFEEKTIELLPTIEQKGLISGVNQDGQF